VPASVIHEAGNKLRELEEGKPLAASSSAGNAPAVGTTPAAATPAQASLFNEPSAVEQALTGIDPDELTPKQALEALYKLKGLV